MARTVLVTGGSGGIGRAVARRFVAAGDDVVLTGRHADTLGAAAAETGARAVACDVSTPSGVEELFGREPGPYDVVVALAGGNTDFDDDEAAGLEGVAAAWRANLDANLLATCSS